MGHRTPSYPAHVAAGLLAPVYFAVMFLLQVLIAGGSPDLAWGSGMVAAALSLLFAAVAVLPCAWLCRSVSRRYLPRPWQQIAFCALPGLLVGMVVAVWLFRGPTSQDTVRSILLLGGASALSTAAGRASVQWTISRSRTATRAALAAG